MKNQQKEKSKLNLNFAKICKSVNKTNVCLVVLIVSSMRSPVALPVPVTMLEEFKENLQLALSWMEEVQRQLKANDCTEGPRDRLEARLQDTKVRVREEPLSDWIKQNENITGLSCRGRQGAAPYFSLSIDTQYPNPLSCHLTVASASQVVRYSSIGW